MILGGMLIPLELFPERMQPILRALPFAGIVYGPARMFVHPDLAFLADLAAAPGDCDRRVCGSGGAGVSCGAGADLWQWRVIFLSIGAMKGIWMFAAVLLLFLHFVSASHRITMLAQARTHLSRRLKFEV